MAPALAAVSVVVTVVAVERGVAGEASRDAAFWAGPSAPTVAAGPARDTAGAAAGTAVVIVVVVAATVEEGE